MGFDYIWHGAPSPGSVPPNAIGLDVVNNVIYTSNGSAWSKVTSGGGNFPTSHTPNQTPNGVLTVFTFTGQASSNTAFQLFWNGLLMQEITDYTISLAGGTTTVTLNRPAQIGDKLVAYY